MKRILITLLLLTLAIPAFAANDKPGKGIKVQPARANWNTGYFQEALVRAGLKELGFNVKKPKELQVPLFYQSVALGDVDYWTNGWFPTHNQNIPENKADKVVKVGYVVKAGGLQGYLVSKREAEKFGITSIADFKRPEVKAAFDKNGDGKADLVACEAGWGCEKTINFHMEEYGLNDHINQIKAGYTASMADTLANYKTGKPVFFYTWAPNWTIFKLMPGKDVVWINVPEIKAREVEMEAIDRMTVTGVQGAITDPLKIGFVSADIRIAANKDFLDNNPAAKKFFEVFNLPLTDINEQNTRMQDGEKAQKKIENHAKEWIKKNQEKWNGWLEAARNAGK